MMTAGISKPSDLCQVKLGLWNPKYRNTIKTTCKYSCTILIPNKHPCSIKCPPQKFPKWKFNFRLPVNVLEDRSLLNMLNSLILGHSHCCLEVLCKFYFSKSDADWQYETAFINVKNLHYKSVPIIIGATQVQHWWKKSGGHRAIV